MTTHTVRILSAPPAVEVCLDAETGDLIPHALEGIMVAQRKSDGFINATAMCKAAGKFFGTWRQNDGTKEFLSELSAVIGNPITALVIVKQGGRPEEQGTWVHPDVAINLAQWCSAKFAVQVSRWVREWMTTAP